jgi:hypothetical protein
MLAVGVLFTGCGDAEKAAGRQQLDEQAEAGGEACVTAAYAAYSACVGGGGGGGGTSP